MKLISADRVLAGPAGRCLEDGAVLVEGARIAAVGTREQLRHREHTRHEHWSGATLLPGLINAHVHLVFDDTAPDPAALVERVRTTSDERLHEQAAGRALRALRSGTTTLRDCGDRDGITARLRDEIRTGATTGPRLITTGPPLTVPDGHCWFLGGAAGTDEELRERVRRNAELGVDMIKVMASGGQITPGSPPSWQSQFDRDRLRLVVAEAERHGLPVAAHAHGTTAIRDAVAAGVRTVEHCSWTTGPGEVHRDAATAAEMAARGVHACAASSRNWRRIIDSLPPEVAEQVYGRLPWLAERGVGLITGTDAGLPASPFDDLAGALQLYVHLGFAADRVVEMATTTSAAALGLGEVTGRLAPGLDADLLVVDGDPRTGLAALGAVRAVFARGAAVG
ncbi:amidohydrolase family protein [Saccharopolyspora gregorii]|uniref:amidohydrolase family protein n=1 Tax=Saccharopolyspora gregorii TaxID=33914 RepID=UPI0021ABCC9C|nr:amidohydrolase family protein [Saccharopolyspora gregorii]